MKSDHVSGTPNQITPTDEIMPDLNHSGIYNTQKCQKTLCVTISNNEYNKVNIKRDNANIDLKKKNNVSKVILRQIDVYRSLLEGKRHQSLAKPGKINF